MSENSLYRALAALESAQTAGDYRRAKLLVGGLDRVSQLSAVDSIRAARRRLEGMGVL